jgi:hypothetical protein
MLFECLLMVPFVACGVVVRVFDRNLLAFGNSPWGQFHSMVHRHTSLTLQAAQPLAFVLLHCIRAGVACNSDYHNGITHPVNYQPVTKERHNVLF